MMTAEPSAADVKRALPYSQQPRYAGSAPAAVAVAKAAASRKAKAPAVAASRADDQENRRRQSAQQQRLRQQQLNDDEDDEEEEDEEDEEEEDDRPLKPSGAAAAAAAGKKSKGKASEEDSSVKSADDDDDKKNTATKKSRRELPPHTVAILKGWMLSPEHVKHPYPTDEDKQMLLKKTGINMKQLTNWFTNARKRIWKPMMRREHSRQLQSAMEYEKARPREAFNPVPGAPQPPYREGEFPPPRAMVSQSFDAGSLGPLRHQQQPPFDPYVRGVEGREAPMYPQQPPPHTFPPRVVRSASEALPRTDMDDYIDAMRIRKRVHERSPDGVEVDALGPSDKRYRRSAIMSPRSLKILQDWVNAHSHLEYPFPTDPEKLQLSRDTGLDVQQIEMWFKNNRERIGAANFAIQNGAPGLSPNRRSLPGRSIPSRDNSMFPPRPAYGERLEARSIPANGNPMFPPRPAAPMQRSSIPANGNPQLPQPPPPPGRREMSEGYNYPNGPPSHPSYGSGQYSGHPAYGAVDPARQVRSMSINASQFMRPQPRLPQPVGAAAPTAAAGVGTGASGLPSLSNRGSVIPRASPGPTMGQPRDGRSHTLDMGLFTDARRRKMNFQDILASTSSSGQHHPSVSRPLSSVGMSETSSNGSNGLHPRSVGGNAENVYPNAMPAYAATVAAGQKSFERPHIAPPVPGCPRCGMRLGSCGCNVGQAHASEDQQQQQRRIV